MHHATKEYVEQNTKKKSGEYVIINSLNRYSSMAPRTWTES